MEASGVEFGDETHRIANVLESFTFIFLPVFRFFYLSIPHGFRFLLTERKLENFCYIVVVIHEFPFMALTAETGVMYKAYSRA
ncbi:hypothetical protein BBJ28_00019061 [Nothophytophthora sp. Chile5]|nr:hypothetical protein BBJ28_00019061 [Nothophytophthora sp. Chile5]